MICDAPITKGPDRGRTATGTWAGYQRHRRRKESPCEPCGGAMRERQREHRAAGYRWDDAKRREGERRRRQLNPEAARERGRRWRAAHPEQARAKSRASVSAWKRANRDKANQWERERHARLRGVATIPFTVEQLAQRMSYWGDRCWMCGGDFDTVDHVKPLIAGGAHCLANLRPACRPCNSAKRETWPLPAEMLRCA